MEKFVKRKVSLPASLKLNIPVKVHLQILNHVPHFLNTPSRMHDCANFGCFLERYIEAIWVRRSLYNWKFLSKDSFSIHFDVYSIFGWRCMTKCLLNFARSLQRSNFLWKWICYIFSRLFKFVLFVPRNDLSTPYKISSYVYM